MVIFPQCHILCSCHFFLHTVFDFWLKLWCVLACLSTLWHFGTPYSIRICRMALKSSFLYTWTHGHKDNDLCNLLSSYQTSTPDCAVQWSLSPGVSLRTVQSSRYHDGDFLEDSYPCLHTLLRQHSSWGGMCFRLAGSFKHGIRLAAETFS